MTIHSFFLHIAGEPAQRLSLAKGQLTSIDGRRVGLQRVTTVIHRRFLAAFRRRRGGVAPTRSKEHQRNCAGARDDATPHVCQSFQ
ncbi:hypothetical protein [Trueperella pyogenes]|uniref:hypothetical protein n=1 Tax=Trueperella pyogenes TaxID=1661 RepID=UPI00345D805F